jgi:hypothetical protein
VTKSLRESRRAETAAHEGLVKQTYLIDERPRGDPPRGGASVDPKVQERHRLAGREATNGSPPVMPLELDDRSWTASNGKTSHGGSGAWVRRSAWASRSRATPTAEAGTEAYRRLASSRGVSAVASSGPCAGPRDAVRRLARRLGGIGHMSEGISSKTKSG